MPVSSHRGRRICRTVALVSLLSLAVVAAHAQEQLNDPDELTAYVVGLWNQESICTFIWDGSTPVSPDLGFAVATPLVALEVPASFPLSLVMSIGSDGTVYGWRTDPTGQPLADPWMVDDSGFLVFDSGATESRVGVLRLSADRMQPLSTTMHQNTIVALGVMTYARIVADESE
jgi:hypothetical protein